MEEETLTTTPTPRVPITPRPTPPSEGSEAHYLWCRDQSIAYEGGTLTTAYGNIIQVWGPGEQPSATQSKDINRRQYSSQRRLNYQDDPTTVNVPARTYKKYPRKNSSGAAAGQIFTFVTAEGDFTARVTGDIQHLIDWVTESRPQQYINFTIYSPRNAKYGPFYTQTLPV